MEQKVSMNKMGVEPIKKLMLAMGIPMIISMVLQAVYNIVDSYFVSGMKDTLEITNMGDCAVNALALSFPVQMLMVAIGVGTGVGINALLSKSLGENNKKKASMIAGNSIFLGICGYLVFLVFGIFGVKAFMQSQTSDPIVLKMSISYLRICTIFSFGVMMYISYEKLLQATGRTLCTTIAQIAGALTNIILDPIMIFGYLGCPQLGMEGAAYATIIGQCVSFVLNAIFHYYFNSKDIDTGLSFIKPNKEIIKEIYQVGIPAILMQALMSFMTYGINIIFGTVSTSAVTAYSIYYKLQQFVFFAAFGMNNAMIPLIGFNYGKRDKIRVHEGIRYGMLYTLIIMALGLVGLNIFAKQLIGIFTLSNTTKELCILAIRIITLGYLFVGANIAYQSIFQALGCGMYSLIVSILRLIVIALPCAYGLSKLPNAQNIIWISFPIAEAGAFVIAVILMRWVKKIRLYDME